MNSSAMDRLRGQQHLLYLLRQVRLGYLAAEAVEKFGPYFEDETYDQELRVIADILEGQREQTAKEEVGQETVRELSGGQGA